MKLEDKSSGASIGDGAKRVMLAALGTLLLVSALIALTNDEWIWFGILAIPAAIVFWIAIMGKSSAVKKAANLVEHSAITLHVPGRTPDSPKSKSEVRDSE